MEDLRRDHSRLPSTLRSIAEGVEALVGEAEEFFTRIIADQPEIDHLLYESFDTDVGGGS